MIVRAIPSLYYPVIEDGLDLFVECLGFETVYRDENLAVLRKDEVRLFLIRDEEIAERCRITRADWGGREFAVRDRTGVCVLVRQFDEGI